MSLEHSPARDGSAAATVTLPRLFDQKEAADYLGVSVKWLERDRWTGPVIPFVKVGKHVRYRGDVLVAYVERQTREAVA